MGDQKEIIKGATDADGNELCGYCGGVTRPESGFPNSRELDHRKPYSKGGESNAANGKLACRTCNRKKGAKDEEEFLRENEEGNDTD